jgi:beta-xylosidase
MFLATSTIARLLFCLACGLTTLSYASSSNSDFRQPGVTNPPPSRRDASDREAIESPAPAPGLVSARGPIAIPLADRPATDAPPLTGDFADPFVLRQGAAYFAFGTSGAGKNIQVASSSDLIGWTALPDALPMLPDWAAKNEGLTWAPSVLQRGGTYVLYYTAHHSASGFQCISRATAPSVAGPYRDDSKQPFICQIDGLDRLCGSIDPSPFVDAAGSPYLLWKSDENSAYCHTAPRLWAQRLSADGLDVVEAPKALLANGQAWEGPVIEAPSMLLHDGVYFLFYSANWFVGSAYAIGYATCATPLGPCKKMTIDAPLFRSTGAALGPGGQEFFSDATGALRMAYHAWTAPKPSYVDGGARTLRIAALAFDHGVPVMSEPKPLGPEPSPD